MRTHQQVHIPFTLMPDLDKFNLVRLVSLASRARMADDMVSFPFEDLLAPLTPPSPPTPPALPDVEDEADDVAYCEESERVDVVGLKNSFKRFPPAGMDLFLELSC